MPLLGPDDHRRLAMGGGRFLADLPLPAGTQEVAFVRSPYAHAGFDSIAGALATGPSLRLRPLVLEGPGLVARPWVALPADRARYAGEPVAMVWAPDRAQAEDLADRVVVGWRPLPLEAPEVLFERRGGGGEPAPEPAGGARVFERTYRAARQAALPMECRGVLACPTSAGGLELWTSTQVPHLVQRDVALATGIPEARIRVRVPHVGGAFGQKAHVFAEEIALAAAALRAGHPLRWVEDRRENLLAASHAHDTEVALRVTVDPKGRFLAVDATVTVDAGAYSIQPFSASLEPMTCAGTLFGPYAVPAVRYTARALASNRAPLGAYRGVGMNAAVYATERMVDEIAAELRIDPLELRRRNAIARLPAVTATGRALDSGDYPRLLEELAERAGYQALRQEQEAARQAGRLVGIGLALFNEHSGTGAADYRRRGVAAVPGTDAARVRVTGEGRILIATSGADAGQGHGETYRALAVARLGVRPEIVDVLEGDTDEAPFGTGTFASRGSVGTADAVDAALRQVAAQDLAPGTDVTVTVDPTQVFPSGAHLALVEVDRPSLRARVLRYVAIEDAGPALHPEVFEGQVRGGIVMGIGNVLLEEIRYSDEGQVLTATLLDYLVPLAADVPSLELGHIESPSPHTATGSKGIGEAGTIGAWGCVANAVADAVRPLGANLDTLPYSPGAIFEALERASAGAAKLEDGAEGAPPGHRAHDVRAPGREAAQHPAEPHAGQPAPGGPSL